MEAAVKAFITLCITAVAVFVLWAVWSLGAQAYDTRDAVPRTADGKVVSRTYWASSITIIGKVIQHHPERFEVCVKVDTQEGCTNVTPAIYNSAREGSSVRVICEYGESGTFYLLDVLQ